MRTKTTQPRSSQQKDAEFRVSSRRMDKDQPGAHHRQYKAAERFPLTTHCYAHRQIYLLCAPWNHKLHDLK